MDKITKGNLNDIYTKTIISDQTLYSSEGFEFHVKNSETPGYSDDNYTITDKDYFYINMKEDATYRIKIISDNDTIGYSDFFLKNKDTGLTSYNMTDTDQDNVKEWSTNALDNWGDPEFEAGEYILEIKGDPTTYTIEVEEFLNVNGTACNAIELEMNGEFISNDILSYEEDWFSFDVVEGQTYDITIDAKEFYERYYNSDKDSIAQYWDLSYKLFAEDKTTEYENWIQNLWMIDKEFSGYHYNLVNFTDLHMLTSVFQADFTGTVYLQTSSKGSEYDPISSKSFDIKVSQREDTISADKNTTASVTIGDTFVSGLENTNDIDWIKVSLEEGKTYQFSVSVDKMDTMAYSDSEMLSFKSYNLYLFDDNKKDREVSRYEENSVEQETLYITYTAEATKDYFLEVDFSHTANYSNYQGRHYEIEERTYYDYALVDYTIDTKEIVFGEDKYSDTMTTSNIDMTNVEIEKGALRFDGQLNSADDIDYIEVDLLAGDYYLNFDSKNIQSILKLGYYEEAYKGLKLYNQNGDEYELTAKSEYYIDMNTFKFTIDKNDKYYIKVEDYNGSEQIGYYFVDDELGNYTIFLNEIGLDDIGGDVNNYVDFNTSGARKLVDIDYTYDTVYVSQFPNITKALEHQGDADWYKYELVAGKSYSLKLESSEVLDGVINVLDSDGNRMWNGLLRYDTDGYVDDIVFTAYSTDDYFIEVVSQNGLQTGEYKLIIEDDVSADDIGSSIDASADFETIKDENNTFKGKINSSSDKDFFKITTETNKSYFITLDSEEMDNETIKIYDKDGNQLANYNDYSILENSDVDKQYYLTTMDSEYYLEVLNSDGSKEKYYTLNIELDPNGDDYYHSVNGAGNFATIDSDNDGVITAKANKKNDKDWFAYEFEANVRYTIRLDAQTDENMSLNVLNSWGHEMYSAIEFNYTQWGESDKPLDVIDFQVDTDTTAYIAVNGGKNENLDYNLTVSYQSDDYSHSYKKAQSFEEIDTDNNNKIDAKIDFNSDADIFKITLEEGETYIFDGLSSSANMMLRLYEDNGYSWADYETDYAKWNTTAPQITYIAQKSGDYYLYVEGSSVGDYSLSVKTGDADDHGNNKYESTDFALLDSSDGTSDDTISAKLETSADIDFFKITLEKDKTYSINGTDGLWIYDVYTNGDELYNTNLILGDDSLSGFNATFTPSQSGDYYFEVRTFNGSSMDYFVTIEEESTDDKYSADISTIGELTLNGNKQKETFESSDDVDWFKFVVTQEDIDAEEPRNLIKFDISASSLLIDSSSDFVIDGIYDSSGEYIENTYANDTKALSFNESKTFYAQTAGEYFISVSTNSANDYNISATVVEQQHRAASDTTKSIDKNGFVIDSIESAFGINWVEVKLEANKEYSVSMNTFGRKSFDTTIYGIYDANSTLLSDTSNDDRSWYSANSTVVFTPSQSGSYYVATGGAGSASGDYKLLLEETNGQTKVVETTSNEVNSTIESAISENALNQYVEGVIDYKGDSDLYEFNLQAGMKYNIDMIGAGGGLGSLMDPLIKAIYDEDGNKIDGAFDDNSGIQRDAKLEFTTDVAGKYYIELASSNNTIGGYSLSVSQANEIASSGSVKAKDTSNSSQETWTLMVYLAADNDLEAAAIRDLNEMEFATLPDYVNVTFMIDRTEGYDTSNDNWTDTRRGVIEHDEDIFKISSKTESLGELNTGSGDTLSSFIDWSTQVASADNYGLVVWDHGGGIFGSAWDDTDGKDNIKIDELQEAIKASSIDKFDMIGFDTCLQGVIDQTYSLKDFADVIVSSEDLEPGDGWDYLNWFNKLNEQTDGITTEELAIATVEAFGEFYSAQSWNQTTLSAVDTSKVDAVIEAFKDFNISLDDLKRSEKRLVDKAFSKLSDFAQGNYTDIGLLANMVDSFDFNRGDVDANAIALQEAIDDAVIANANEYEGAMGISFYTGSQTSKYTKYFEVAQETQIDELYDIIA
jgi:hypothetical protein